MGFGVRRSRADSGSPRRASVPAAKGRPEARSQTPPGNRNRSGPPQRPGPILFRLDWQKAIETAAFLAKEQPDIDIYHLVKTIFLADKRHVNKYARPVVGGIYKKMEHGPVPRSVYRLLSGSLEIDPDIAARLDQAVIVGGERYPTFRNRREPELDYFSETDLAELRAALADFGRKSFPEIRTLTHMEKCFTETPDDGIIDYALFVDDDNPHRDEILRVMRTICDKAAV